MLAAAKLRPEDALPFLSLASVLYLGLAVFFLLGSRSLEIKMLILGILTAVALSFWNRLSSTAVSPSKGEMPRGTTN